jgi:hypothetical protein
MLINSSVYSKRLLTEERDTTLFSDCLETGVCWYLCVLHNCFTFLRAD